MEKLKPWGEVSETEIDRIRRSKCIYCKYSSGLDAETKSKWVRRTTCDYIIYTRRRRGVRPELCEYWKE